MINHCFRGSILRGVIILLLTNLVFKRMFSLMIDCNFQILSINNFRKIVKQTLVNLIKFAKPIRSAIIFRLIWKTCCEIKKTIISQL